ncbi:MAG TPA: beta-ketoacyl-[acyl-carrier-protein] synthase family protein [Burkholderiales bacterium]|nr:beta-ketoacyl-[acyl-carrier-protein] synthase family protein [Burkholderiales bacterium]
MTKNSRRVVISGLGVISPVGNTANEFFANLLAGHSGIRWFGDSGQVVGTVVDFDPSVYFTKPQLVGLDRVSQFGLTAAEQAVLDAKLDATALEAGRAGVYFGSGIGGANAIESGYRSFFDNSDGRMPPLTVISTMANATAAHLSMRYGIRGPVMTYSIACASSAVAIGEAYRAIRDGYIDVALAGGAEAMVTPVMVAAWAALRVLAKPDINFPEQSCKPFSKGRTGMVLGEGAGVLVLEALETAIVRQPKIWGEIAGYGISSDACHISKPSPAGQVGAIKAAIEDSQLAITDIGYINAHGTATQLGDVVETAAIKAVFGSAAHNIPVSSTKALHGHLMGAAGAVEMVASLLTLNAGSVPPTCHYSEADPDCDLDYVPNTARKGLDINAVMSNSFAFGGTNAVLIAKRFVQRHPRLTKDSSNPGLR